MILSKFISKKPCMLLDGTFYYVKKFYMKKFIFLYYVGVKNRSYMGSVFARLFDHYYKHSKSLYSEYRHFYGKEFKSFEEYLEKKHNFMDDEIKIFNDKNLYFKIYGSKPAWNLENLIRFDEEIKENFWKFFGGLIGGGLIDED